jgi:TonB family protein
MWKWTSAFIESQSANDMMQSILLAALLLLSSGFGSGQVASGANSSTGALSDMALIRMGGGNASGYEILSPVGGWDAPEYADGMLISIRANWYPQILSLPHPPAGQRETIIEVHIRGNGTIGHMGRHSSRGSRAQDKAAWDAVRAAAPFRPLPAELQKEKTLKLRFHFNYNLPQADERPVCGPPPPGTFRVNSEVTAPRVQSSPDAEFSESARRDKYQDEIELRLTVAENGQVRDVCVSQSLGEGLDEQSVAAIRNWKFEPGTREGKPVPVWISVTTNFHLY